MGWAKKYMVSWRVLSTADFGLPQNRTRLYIIGIKRVVLQGRQLPPFKWPRSVGCVPLASVLESGQVRKQPRPGTVAENNIHTLQRRLTDKKEMCPPRLLPWAYLRLKADSLSEKHRA